jgi:hypothetical protein
MVGTNSNFNKGTGSNKRCYFIDFAIIYENLKFGIEFQGDYWHKNPDVYGDEERKKCILDDEVKEEFLSQEDFFICTIWEKDYKENKQEWIDYFLKQMDIIYFIYCGIKILKEKNDE